MPLDQLREPVRRHIERQHERLVGGVHLILSPEIRVALCQARMMSADGRCKTFDAAADGFGQGEGCGVVVLKRYSDALASTIALGMPSRSAASWAESASCHAVMNCSGVTL